jgi:SSS family solute:Na+ symporter
MAAGTAMTASLGLRSSVYPFHIGGHTYGIYAALPALVLNLGVAGVFSLLLRMSGRVPADDLISGESPGAALR